MLNTSPTTETYSRQHNNMANKQTRALRKAVSKADRKVFCLHTNNTGAAPSPVQKHEHGRWAFQGEVRKNSKPVFQGKRTDLPPWMDGWVAGMPPKKVAVAIPSSTKGKPTPQTVFSAQRKIDLVGVKASTQDNKTKGGPQNNSAGFKPQQPAKPGPGHHQPGVKNSTLKSPFKHGAVKKAQ